MLQSSHQKQTYLKAMLCDACSQKGKYGEPWDDQPCKHALVATRPVKPVPPKGNRKKRGLNMFGQGQAFAFLPALSPKQVCPLPRPEPAKSCSKAEQTVHWGLRTSKLGTKGISAARKQRQEHVLPHCRCPPAFPLSSPTFPRNASEDHSLG